MYVPLDATEQLRGKEAFIVPFAGLTVVELVLPSLPFDPAPVMPPEILAVAAVAAAAAAGAATAAAVHLGISLEYSELEIKHRTNSSTSDDITHATVPFANSRAHGQGQTVSYKYLYIASAGCLLLQRAVSSC